MMKKVLLGIFVTTVGLAGNAQAVQFDGVVKSSIVTKNQNSYLSGESAKKEVYLMKVKLTPQEKENIINLKSAKTFSFNQQSKLPRKVQLGMNNVPVLNQGRHGSCVTFANTAAIDAVLNKGDYVSQLCNLELGRYLEKNGYLSSGWSGTYGGDVLSQISAFGFINKANQKSKSCAGVTEYPIHDEQNIGHPMSLEDFKKMSEHANNLVFDSVLTPFQRMYWVRKHSPNTPDTQAEDVLTQVKDTLADPDAKDSARITFGTLLFANHCSAGACGRYHTQDDTWALTKEIVEDKDPDIAGHEMVITGYDDDAVATDDDGAKHHGLLTLRNSWGSDAGDQGNYYMSYDFFKKFVLESHIVISFQEN